MAEGVLQIVEKKMNVKINLSASYVIHAPIICVDVVNAASSVVSRQSIDSLQKNLTMTDDASSKVMIFWPLHFTRRTLQQDKNLLSTQNMQS